MPTYTLKSGAPAASIFFVAENGLTNLGTTGGSVTTTGTITTSTQDGHTVYGSGATAGNYLNVSGGAIATNTKYAVLRVEHYGLTAGTDREMANGAGTISFGTQFTSGATRTWSYAPVVGLVTGTTMTGYSHPSPELWTIIGGRESDNTLRTYVDGTTKGTDAGSAGSVSVAAGTWKFAGSPGGTYAGGAGVAIFAVFIGTSPSELAAYIAANAGSSTGAEQAYTALLDVAAGDATGTGSVASASLTAPNGSATGTSPNGSASGSFGAVTLTAPNGTATGSTLNGSASGAVSAVSLTAATGSASGTTSGAGTITLGPLKNNTGTVLASLTGITVHVYQTSGALVVTKTGQTTNGSGTLVVSDAAIAAATQYRCVIVLGTGAEGMDKATAA